MNQEFRKDPQTRGKGSFKFKKSQYGCHIRVAFWISGPVLEITYVLKKSDKVIVVL